MLCRRFVSQLQNQGLGPCDVERLGSRYGGFQGLFNDGLLLGPVLVNDDPNAVALWQWRAVNRVPAIHQKIDNIALEIVEQVIKIRIVNITTGFFAGHIGLGQGRVDQPADIVRFSPMLGLRIQDDLGFPGLDGFPLAWGNQPETFRQIIRVEGARIGPLGADASPKLACLRVYDLDPQAVKSVAGALRAVACSHNQIS